MRARRESERTRRGVSGAARAREGRPLAALLLDLDDTILDDGAGADEASARAVDRVLERHPDLEREALVARIERGRRWFWGDPERHRRGRLDLVAARAWILGEALEALGRPDPAVAREAARLQTELRERHQRFLPGAREALTRLRAMVPALALVTNGASTAQRAKIERFGLATHFDHIQIEGEFGTGKPDGVVYEHVLERLGVRAEGCMMVGDNFEADVLGAQSVGLHGVWIDKHRRGRPGREAPRPYWTVRSLGELIDLLASR